MRLRPISRQPNSAPRHASLRTKNCGLRKRVPMIGIVRTLNVAQLRTKPSTGATT
jgi:hypothetical protein